MNNEITYHKVGDYYLPNIYLKKEKKIIKLEGMVI